MKVWRVEFFGYEVLKIEMSEQVSLGDVMRRIMDGDAGSDDDESEDEYEEITEGLIPCECCGEMFAPDDEVEKNVFAQMTERMVWGMDTADHPDHPLD